MRLTFDRKAILSAMRLAAPVARRGKKFKEQTGCVRISAVTDSASIEATDLDTAVRSTLTGHHCEVHDAGVSCVPAESFAAVCADGAAERIEIYDTGSRVRVQCGEATWNLSSPPPDGFPEIDSLNQRNKLPSCELKAYDLARALRFSVMAIGTEDPKAKYQYRCVAMQAAGSRLNCAASNRSWISTVEVPLDTAMSDDSTIDAKLPEIGVRLFADALETMGEEDTVQIWANPMGVTIAAGGQRCSTRVLDGVFPPWRAIVPKKTTVSFDAEAGHLVKAFRSLSAVGANAAILAISIKEGRILLRSSDPEAITGDAETTAPIANISGDASDTARIDLRWLRPIVQALESDDKVRIGIVFNQLVTVTNGDWMNICSLLEKPGGGK